MNQDGLRFLGLAFSAGAVITGEEQVIQAVRNKKVYLVIVAEDISPQTLKKVTDKCKFYGIPWIQKGTSEKLGHALGKGFRKIIGIADQNFAQALEKKINVVNTSTTIEKKR